MAPIGDVVYSVGHAHYCANIGGFPDTTPRSAWYYALAVSKRAAGKVAAPLKPQQNDRPEYVAKT